MKMITKILIGLVILMAILLITALFVKKDYTIAREITINRPRQDVFNYIKYLRNQENYNKWTMSDPGMKKDYRGKDGTPGFVYAWDSKERNVGKGEQEIKKITEGERVDMEIRFKRPFEGRADVYMSTEAVAADQTRVQWVFSSRMPYPMNIMRLFMNLEDMLGKDLDTSLGNLKRVLEQQP